MKILVIDDYAGNQSAAKAQLAAHDLTIVSTVDEARDLLCSKESTQHFDAVLCDMLMPGGCECYIGYETAKLSAQEMPVGFALTLMAVIHGAKYVAMVTDTGHHHHPISALIDSLETAGWKNNIPIRRIFSIDGARVGYYHAPMVKVEGGTYSKDWGKVLTTLIEG